MRRLPAEWERQSAVMITWPHAETDWADRLAEVTELYTLVASTIARFEPVLIVCRDATHRGRIMARLERAGIAPRRVIFAQAMSNDTWTRDQGPITVIRDGAPLLLDFRFNGWGGRFPADKDDRINATLHAAGAFGDVPLESSPMVLEGGAIETDGRGTLLAVTRTLVDARRNPGWSRGRIQGELERQLGAHRFLWLEHGRLRGDDTDGHVDTLARFGGSDTICHVRCEDPGDPDFAGLAAMEGELEAFRRATGRPYRLVPLPHPAPVLDADGRRLPASYANFLILNGAVLLPAFGDPADGTALARIRALFPNRQVLPIDCRPLLRQGGGLHCMGMSLPGPLRLIATGGGT
jgi:agmatine/peptidylarginine deiminase